MPRTISASQLRSKLQQAQRKQKQAIDKYNRDVRKHNQNVVQQRRKLSSAINTYNSDVRKHNARVRANQSRLRSEVARLSSSSSGRFRDVRASTTRLTTAYSVLDSNESNLLETRNGANFLDLSEKEAADSAEITNSLAENNFSNDDTIESKIDCELLNISADLDNRWKGALYSLSPKNPDAARHFCTGTREILVKILNQFAPDSIVKEKLENLELTQQGQVSRKSKIRHILVERGIGSAAAIEFVDEDVGNVLTLFGVFNDGTHGEAGRYSLSELRALKDRAEQGILYLCRICSMS